MKILSVPLLLLLSIFSAQAGTDAIADKLPEPVKGVGTSEAICQHDGIIVDGDTYTNLTTLKFFGTSISVQVYDAGDNDAEQALCDSLKIIKRLHELGSDYNTYDGVVNIKSINNDPTSVHHIDPELVGLIQAGIDWHSISKGYFNIAVGPVVQVWRGYRKQCQRGGECRLPSEDELLEASRFTDIKKINLDANKGTVSLSEGMSLDLGGIAKGWMAERVHDQLVESGMRSFVINAGGNIRHHGLHPEQRPFVTAIEDPLCKKSEFTRSGCDKVENQFHEFISGENLTIVSSGNYLNYYQVGDDEYHHIIDPNTLRPKKDGVSTSVVMNDQHIYADVLSTTLFLMPLDEAKAMAESLPYLEAVWYLDEHGNKNATKDFDKYRIEVEF